MSSENSGAPFSIDSIVSAVQSIFTVSNQYLREDGSMEFEVAETKTLKRDFGKLTGTLKPHGYLPLLRRVDGRIVLKVGSFTYEEKKASPIPIILLMATIVTVSIDGYFRTPSLPGYNPTLTIVLYIAGVMGIIGMHELSHKVASARHGMRSSNPYFIPGIPSLLPTFGAFISTKDPPVNRDSLFDLGLSGPLAGLVVTLIVGVAGAFTTVIVPANIVEQAGFKDVTVDMFTAYTISLFKQPPEGMVVTLSPLNFAATLGFLITFLNLMPAWQLDGGHIAGAILSKKQHKYATYLSIAILFLLGFTFMAVLVLIMSMRNPEATPLDDVSELSASRKLIFVGVIILAVALYFYTIADNPYFVIGFGI